MATFPLELVTPDRLLLEENVKSVRIPGIDGSLGILSGHAPLMTALTIGLIKVEHENGDLEYIATSGGFVEVNRDKVVILADTAERSSDIDVSRAESSLARAKEHLNSGEAIDYNRARFALERATNRLTVAQSANHKE